MVQEVVARGNRGEHAAHVRRKAGGNHRRER
jgi:hypothetical protein